MHRFRPRTERRFLDLNKVADPYGVGKSGIRPKVRIWADRNLFTKGGIGDHAAIKYNRPRANFGVRDTREGVNRYIFADEGLTLDLY